MSRKEMRIGRIGYVNVDPIYYGLENESARAWLHQTVAPPAVLNGMFERGELRISAISSSAYASNPKNKLILPGLSVSCFGDVMSVLFVSRFKIRELDGKRVAVSDESKTAADLLRIFLASNNVDPVFVKKRVNRHSDVEEDAALVIGDAALKRGWSESFDHVLDLGDLWRDMTSLPFVFALWVVDREFAKNNADRVKEVLGILHESKQKGLENLEAVIQNASAKLEVSVEKCRRYFEQLDFGLEEPQIEGLKSFFARLWRHGLINEKAALDFFPAE